VNFPAKIGYLHNKKNTCALILRVVFSVKLFLCIFFPNNKNMQFNNCQNETHPLFFDLWSLYF
jgi:hypothetical protein